MVNILGPRDEFLRILERELDANIHVRGNEITLSGRTLPSTLRLMSSPSW